MFNRIMGYFGLQEEEEIYEEIEEPEQEERREDRKRQQSGNVVSLHSQKNVKLVLFEPRTYEEAQEIADHLRNRKPVVVNLQRMRKEQAVRMVDFLSGTVYAVNGNIQKLGHDIFLCTPDNVEVHGTITDMAKDDVDRA